MQLLLTRGALYYLGGVIVISSGEQTRLKKKCLTTENQVANHVPLWLSSIIMV